MKKAIDACVVGPTKCSDTAGAGARTQSQRALVKAPYAKSYFIVLYSLSMREKTVTYYRCHGQVSISRAPAVIPGHLAGILDSQSESLKPQILPPSFLPLSLSPSYYTPIFFSF